MALTGMMIGGVTPFGLPSDLPIYADAKLSGLDYVIIGGGKQVVEDQAGAVGAWEAAEPGVHQGSVAGVGARVRLPCRESSPYLTEATSHLTLLSAAQRFGARWEVDMFETIGRSFRLAKLCLHVLAVDKELIMFPVFSSIGVVLVLLSFGGVGIGIGALNRIEAGAIGMAGTL